MNGKQLAEKLGGQFEHTGGNCWSVCAGDLIIGMFNSQGEPQGKLEAFDLRRDMSVELPAEAQDQS